MEVRCTSSKNPRVVRLPDELVTEILTRVPYRSLCQFRCVSRSWRDLCSEPAILRRCPQTLAGFFFGTIPIGHSEYICDFVNVSGRGPPMFGPSMPFLPRVYSHAGFLDCCNGLLLCDSVYGYFVCNPVTKTWIGLPNPKVSPKLYGVRVFRLCFDPAMSSRFRVFLFVSGAWPRAIWNEVTGVEIFSSETGEWSCVQSEWGDRATVGWGSVFFNGTLHLTSPGSTSLLTVDMGGKVWGKIPTPHYFSFVGVSQGRLHAVQIRNHQRDDESIGIWVLEDYAGQQWTLKHAVSALQMFGARPTSFGDSYSFIVHAVHPEHGVIFLTAGKQRSLISYDMGKKEVRFIRTIIEESNSCARPYVPCFLDWLPDGH